MNETVKKPSLRSVVAYYLSAKGRHVEFNVFQLAKIEILFRSHTFLYNIRKPLFKFYFIDVRYS